MKIRTHTEVGMPFHGLATDGVATINGEITAINGDGAAVLVRNPLAPGASRNAAQQTRDLDQGHEWRNYALLCGSSRAVNGGPELGSNAWLYIDGNGTPWRMTLEATPNGNQVDLMVWRRELFGRSGNRDYSAIVDEQVGSFTWYPELPTGYAGSSTLADVANLALCNNAEAITPNKTGSLLYINIHTRNSALSDVFAATRSGGRSLLSVLTISVSGSGNIATTGAGISASVTQTHAYNADLVVTDVDTFTGEPQGVWAIQGNSCIPAAPPSFLGETTVVTHTAGPVLQSGLTVGKRNWGVIEREGIVHVCHEGAITRRVKNETYLRFVSQQGGSFSVDITYTAIDNGQDLVWSFTSCANESLDIYEVLGAGGTFRNLVQSVNIFGTLYEFEEYWEQVANGDRHYDDTYNNCGCAASNSDPNTPVGGDFTTFTVNGVSYPTTGVDEVAPVMDVKFQANNLFLVRGHYRKSDNVTRDVREYAVAVGEAGASEIWTRSQDWAQGLFEASAYPPYDDNWSFQPVTLEYSHDDLFGDEFQYF